MILHTVNKSPYTSQCLADCLKRVAPGDKVILIEDGVYGIHHETSSALALLNDTIEKLSAADVQFCALLPDIEARGLQTPVNNIYSFVSDADFVDLVCRADKTLSWY